MSIWFWFKLALAVAVVVILLSLLIKHWAKLVQFKDEVMQEMHKVTWPSQQEIINGTALVGVVAIIMTIFIWGVDWVFGNIVKLIY